jgi:HEAT repeat protein
MLLELVMSATMQSGRALHDVARKRAEPVAVQETRIAPDVLEVAACERALREDLARPGCDAASVAERLLAQGFPPLEPAWALLWSAEARGPMASAFAKANVSHLDVLGRIALAAPAAGVRRTLALCIAGEPSAEQVLWIAAHLGAHGSWREVDLALGLSRVDADWLGLDPDALRGTIVDTLAGILARDPLAFGALRSAAQAAPEGFGPLGLEALGRSSGARALATLSELLDGRRLGAASVVGAIESVGRRSVPPFDEFLLQRLRELAVDEDPQLRSAALRAAAALGDEESLPLQISGLMFEHGDVRSAAGDALGELTGLHFGNDTERWTSWYANEIGWWDGEAPLVLEHLADDDTPTAIAALSELVTHRLYRARLAHAVAGLLEDESPELRRLACLTLEQLDGRVVAPALVERLADVDDAVRESAHRCLTTLFGLDLPPELEAWKAELERKDLVLR